MVFQERGSDNGGRRLYVGNIHYDVREEELRAACDKFGETTAVLFKTGYCFVDFKHPSDAKECLYGLNGQKLSGRILNIDFAGRPKAQSGRRDGIDGRRGPEDNRSDKCGNFADNGGDSRDGDSSGGATKNLFVANLPAALSEAEVRDHFSKYGAVNQVKFLPQKGENRAAFVDFATIEEATRAHEASHTLEGSRIRTDYNSRPTGYNGGGSSFGGRDGDFRPTRHSPPRHDGDFRPRSPPRRSPPRDHRDERGPNSCEYTRCDAERRDNRYERPEPDRYAPPLDSGGGDRYGPPPERDYRERAPPPRYGDVGRHERDPPRGSYDDRREPPRDPPRDGYDDRREPLRDPPRGGYDDRREPPRDYRDERGPPSREYRRYDAERRDDRYESQGPPRRYERDRY